MPKINTTSADKSWRHQ